ncbi:putative addiction module killer protein [Sphingomonas sp. BE270]|uniref:type II toxin-antitoxin system RelE/ParE family toxin n=1 Tax=unclassified Sphingomonas TaxID=196159 RepID=UPI000A41D5D4|nr:MULTISPECIES: type II toxin-antitoxin system RelE/ParE family toxin [unclassified Sphingomonas]MDR6850000.1 putative addiction module killer protein [Sphingomonas sp. BE137]MDR7259754.1 putative addiction module killer protein [Sphingomonas sp. BE270]
MTDDFDRRKSVLYKGQINEVWQTSEFHEWLTSLRDLRGRARIFDRLLRVADGNFGDAKSVGEGVEELRLHFGPGYRVYFKRQGSAIVLLLAGGDKSGQRRDIATAIELARREEYGAENDDL